MKVNIPEVTLTELVEISRKYGTQDSMEKFRTALETERPELMGVVYTQLSTLPENSETMELTPGVFFLSGFMYAASILNDLLEEDDTPKVTLQ